MTDDLTNNTSAYHEDFLDGSLSVDHIDAIQCNEAEHHETHKED